MKINSDGVFCTAKIADIPTQRKITLNECDLKGYTAFLNGDVYLKDNGIRNVNLLFKDNKLIAIDDCSDDIKETKVVDVKGKYITPAIFEQHIHGGLSCDFNSSDELSIRNFLKELKKSGCAELLATLASDNISNINKQVKIIDKIIDTPSEDEAKIIGINLEGPFLNPVKKGIHNADLIIKPSVSEFKKIKSDNIKMVTLAPEEDKDYRLANYLNQKGIIVSAGHSAASASDIRNSGIKQVTHLFNAMPPLASREDGMLKEALINDDVTVEVIPDLNHLTADTIKLIKKVKPEDKVIFVSDALSETHSNKDEFLMQGKKVRKHEDGYAAEFDSAGNVTLAGSLMFLSDSAKKIVKQTTIAFDKFIRFACVNPAKNLNRENYFTLEKGKTPNFVIWDKEKMLPEKTFVTYA